MVPLAKVARLPLQSRAWPVLLVGCSLAVSLAYALATPLWQAPDEPGHWEQAALLAREGGPLRRHDRDPALEQALLDSLARHRFWTLVRAPWPEPLPVRLADDPFLARSGRQVGDEPLAYYLPLAFLLRLAPDVDGQARLARAYSLALFGLTVALAWATARELFPGDAFLPPAATAFVGLLPMAAYMGMAVNNDVAAALVGTAHAWGLVRLARRGLRPGVLAVLIPCALAGLWVKKTAAFLFPLTALVLLTALWRRRRARGRAGVPWRALGRRAAAVAGGALALWLFLQAPGPEPAAWLDGTLPGSQGRARAAAREGRYGFQAVDDSSTAVERLVQALPTVPLAGRTVALTAFARSPEGPGVGRLALIPDQGEACREVFQVGEAWQRVEVRCPVPAEAQGVKAVLAAGRGDDPSEQSRLYFDDAALQVEGAAENFLRNGGAEEAASLGTSLALRGRRWLQDLRLWLGPRALRRLEQWTRWCVALPNALRREGAAWARLALYAVLTFAGFWGNFGWLTVPLSAGWYLLLSLATLVAAAGWVHWWARGAMEPWQRRACGWLALALLLAALQNLLPMLLREWQPQGRYLLPALFPAAASFALGWRALVPEGWARWGAVPFVAAFVLLNLACLVGYVIPYFHG